MKKLSILSLILLAFASWSFGQDRTDIVPAKFVSGPNFTISPDDEAVGIGGTMKIGVMVDKSGSVTKSWTIVGPSWPCTPNIDDRIENLMKEVETQVMQYKFNPALKNGSPVESLMGFDLKLTEDTSFEGHLGVPQTGDSSRQKFVREDVLNGKATLLAKPAYPAAAKAAHASGRVLIDVLIDENGNVMRAQAVEGNPILQFASRRAACASKFSPTRVKGDPVKVKGIITYTFVAP